MTEAQHQASVIQWSQQPVIRARWPELALLHHIPNGGRRDPVEARHLQAQGVKRGVPDLCLPVARDIYHGLYIELKTAQGRTSPDQKWWGEKLLEQGYFWDVCRGWKDAVRMLEWYLSLKGRPCCGDRI